MYFGFNINWVIFGTFYYIKVVFLSKFLSIVYKIGLFISLNTETKLLNLISMIKHRHFIIIYAIKFLPFWNPLAGILCLLCESHVKLSAFCLCSSLVKLQPFGTKTRQNVIRNVNSTISAKVFYKCTFIKYPFIENIDNNVNRLYIRYQNIGEWAGY